MRVVGSVLRVRCCSGGGPEQAPAMNPKKMARLWHNLRVPFTFGPSVEVGLGWIPQTLLTFAPLQQATQLGARSQNSVLHDSLYCEISRQSDNLPGMAKRTYTKQPPSTAPRLPPLRPNQLDPLRRKRPTMLPGRVSWVYDASLWLEKIVRYPCGAKSKNSGKRLPR